MDSLQQLLSRSATQAGFAWNRLAPPGKLAKHFRRAVAAGDYINLEAAWSQAEDLPALEAWLTTLLRGLPTTHTAASAADLRAVAVTLRSGIAVAYLLALRDPARPEFRHMLYAAFGSAGEPRSHLTGDGLSTLDPLLSELVGLHSATHRDQLAVARGWLESLTRDGGAAGGVRCERVVAAPLLAVVGGQGRVFRLRLALLHDGCGAWVADPDGLGLRLMSREFMATQGAALALAQQHAPELGARDLWWTLEGDDGTQPEWLDGASAGAVLAVALTRLLRGEPYDELCTLSACLPVAGEQLGPVSGVAEKTRAAFSWIDPESGRPRIRRVLVHPGNLPEADQSARASPGLIGKVEEVATFSEALRASSGRLAIVAHYLQALSATEDAHQPLYLGGRPPSALYVEPQVVYRGGRESSSDSLPTPLWQLPNSLVEEERQQSVPPTRLDSPRPLPGSWQREWSRLGSLSDSGPAVILGLPGSGKTTLGRHTVAGVAAQCLASLRRGHGLAGALIPVWLRLSDVAAQGSVDAAMAQAVHQWLALPGQQELRENGELLLAELASRFEEGTLALFLDALDEVPESDFPRLRTALETLQGSRCRMVITSRLHLWSRVRECFPRCALYELAPLTDPQISRFLTNWASASARAQLTPGEVKAEVETIPSRDIHFREISRTPLLLTLACAAVEIHGTPVAGGRLPQLYAAVIEGLVDGVWKPDKAPIATERRSSLRFLLPALAWELLGEDPSRASFSEEELHAALGRAGGGMDWRWREEVRRELSEAGLLIPAGTGRCMFLHRSILEYLAGKHLAAQPQIVELIRPFLWQHQEDGWVRWKPAATELIVWAGACARDSGPILAALLAEHYRLPDLFSPFLVMAGRILSRRGDSPSEALSQTCALHLLALLSRHSADEAKALLEHWAPAFSFPAAVAQLVEALKLPALKGPAATLLGLLGAREAVPTLISVLFDFNENARDAVAVALASIASPEAVQALITALSNCETVATQYAAANALIRSPSPNSEQCLRDWPTLKSELARSVAAITLTRWDSDESTPIILQALADPSALVRRHVVQLMDWGGCQSQMVIEALARLLTDPCEQVCLAARNALVEIGSQTDVVADAVKPYLRHQAADTRDHAAHILWTLHTSNGLPPLLAALKDERPEVRRTAVSYLLADGSTRQEAVVGLISALGDEDLQVRELAVRKLNSLAPIEAVLPLIQLLQRESADDIRRITVIALGRIGSAEAIPPLLQVLNTGSEFFQVSVARALGKIARTAANPDIVQVLAGIAAKTPFVAASGLGQTESEEAIPLLLSLYESGEPRVREMALSSLSRIASTACIAPILVASRSRGGLLGSIAVQTLGRIQSSRIIPILRELIHDSNTEVRKAAFEALDNLGAPDLPSLLAAAIVDSDPSMRRFAFEKLAQAEAPRSQALFLRLAFDIEPGIRKAAVDVLGRTGSVQTVPLLLLASEDDDGGVRKVALNSLVELGMARGGWIRPLSLDPHLHSPVR